MFSFGLFPGVCSLKANVSEHTVCYNRLAYEDGTVFSETLEFKIQTPGNNPKENIQQLKHGESLKSRII
jgi:hypothetical protein